MNHIALQPLFAAHFVEHHTNPAAFSGLQAGEGCAACKHVLGCSDGCLEELAVLRPGLARFAYLRRMELSGIHLHRKEGPRPRRWRSA